MPPGSSKEGIQGLYKMAEARQRLGGERFSMTKEADSIESRVAWALLLVVVFAAGAIRAGLLDIPLDRDEGDYAHGAQLMMQGSIPYQQHYQMKLPGVYLAYAAILTTFGQTHVAVHMGLLTANAATTLLIFLLGRRIADPLIGLLAGASFSVLSLGYPLHGTSGNTEHFVILAGVAGLWVLLEALDRDWNALLFVSGLLLGMAYLMKQHGFVFAAIGVCALIIDRNRTPLIPWKKVRFRGLVLCTGLLLPYAASIAYFWKVGALGDFWYWTVEYSQSYLGRWSLSGGFSRLVFNAERILKVGWPLWGLAAIGIVGLWSNPSMRSQRGFLLVFAFFSLVSISPGFVFRTHYFILLLPVLALLSAMGTATVVDAFRSHLKRLPRYTCACLLMGVSAGSSIFIQRDFLFQMTPFTASRFVFGRNPFPESIEIAERIRADTNPRDSIAVLGSEPQIYFYADRPAATGQVYMYPLMASHPRALELQERMIREIEVAKPKYIVYVDPETIPWSWLRNRGSHLRVLEWFRGYREQYYERVGIFEFNRFATNSRWGAKADGKPSFAHWVEILRRREK